MRSPHRIVRRRDRFTWIGQLGRGGVQVVDIHEITNVRVMACSDMILVIRGLRKGNKGQHGECFRSSGSHCFGTYRYLDLDLHKHHTLEQAATFWSSCPSCPDLPTENHTLLLI